MFIVFEGIDNSGKSTISKMFVQALNKEKTFKYSLDALSTGDKFTWTKEPLFSTEEADLLNSPQCKDELNRELLFYVSRLKHQESMRNANVVCDRYVWTGIAYAKLFSPKAYNFLKVLYPNREVFIQPDLYIFVDTDPRICHERDPREPLDLLIKKRRSYQETQKYVGCPVLTIEANQDPETTMADLILKVNQCFL